MISWGKPSDPHTFSGYSSGLNGALRKQCAIRREFSYKQIRYRDILDGAFILKKRGRFFPKPIVSRSWMWSERGQRILSDRFRAMLRQSGDRGAFLQIGTLVEVSPEFGPHFMLTDMTIPQAVRQGMFDVGEMTSAEQKVAVAVQHHVLHSASHIFVLSDWCKQSMVRDFGLKPDKVSVVYAGSNLVVPERFIEPKRDHEVLFVGIDWERKGGPLLLEAFKMVRAELPYATLRIVGCQVKTDQPGVCCEGFLDKRNSAQYELLQRLYLRASVFCLPSLFDPFPNVLIEAASVGLPSVAIDNGSRREAVIDGVTGVLAPQANPRSVADALLNILRNPERSREMGEAARAHASKNFTWDRVVEKIGAAVQVSRLGCGH
jgi:glycosyltransferase involved in cell wall biosynthesis